MKKIIAIWLSINLLALNALPTLAQVPVRQVSRGLTRGIKNQPPAGLIKGRPIGTPVAPAAGAALLNQQLSKAVLNEARLPLDYTHLELLNVQAYTPLARQMLTYPDLATRNRLLRTDFLSCVLKNRASEADKAHAADLYRTDLQQSGQSPVETVTNIASLGIVGSIGDAGLILQAVDQTPDLAAKAVVTAAAARALLRLEAYEQLAKLAEQSTVQPALWDGINTYVQAHQLPLQIASHPRQTIPVEELQHQLQDWGPLNYVAADPRVQSTFLYMNAGKLAATRADKKLSTHPAQIAQEIPPLAEEKISEGTEHFIVAPTQTAAAKTAQQAAMRTEPTKAAIISQAKQWIERLKPQGFTSADGTKFAQRAALYLTAFSIGLEIGTPIMASMKTALNLPLSLAVLVTAATYAPYLFGSFLANWLKTKIGRKGTINTGIGLMGGSFALGATSLGLDGSFTAWDNPVAQFLSILAALTVASTGSVFIHNAVGPVMTEISQKANDLVRQKRGTYVELSRSMGMMASFAFPFIATKILNMDWSAPFLLALPFVAASALTLNWAKLPNTKPVELPAPKLAQSPVMEGLRKPRKAMQWKNFLLNNSYVRLLREEPGVGSFISALFLMNGVEMGINSGFLFMLPQLTGNESDRYLLGMCQFAIPFLAGRYLAGHFLKWFPKRNISVATWLASTSALASLGLTGNVYALTAALATAELGISTAFTLSFARTAKNHITQDRVTSLIMATAVACAVGPLFLTQIAQGLMDSGILNETGATMAALIGVPSLLGFISAQLLRRMENKTAQIKAKGKSWLAGIKNFFKKK